MMMGLITERAIDWWAEWVMFLPMTLLLKSRYPIIRILSLPLFVVWMPVFIIAGIVFLVLMLANIVEATWKGEL